MIAHEVKFQCIYSVNYYFVISLEHNLDSFAWKPTTHQAKLILKF
jgi:hypothetical protein